jgi:DNA-binding transcriptional MerR regulator
MRSGEVGKLLGIDRSTVKNWTDRPELTKYFTESARRGVELQREYDQADILVINTIRTERQRGAKWSDIAALLETGYRDADLPLSASTVEMTPAETFAKSLQLQIERDRAMELVAQYKDMLETKERELEAAHQAKAAETERLMREIGDLREQIGGLKMQIKILTEPKE